MAAPTVSFSSGHTQSFGSPSSVTTGLPSSGAGSAAANDVAIVAAVCNVSSGSPPAVTSITTDTGSFSWTQLYGNTIGVLRFEVWWAPITANFGSVTATFASSASAVGVGILGARGVFDPLSPFDGNASLPAIGTASSPSLLPSRTISTNQPEDLIVGISTGFGSFANTGDPFLDGGSATFSINLDNGQSSLNVGYYSVTSTQTLLTVPGTGGGHDTWGMEMILALTANAKAQAFQTFVTIICS